MLRENDPLGIFYLAVLRLITDHIENAVANQALHCRILKIMLNKSFGAQDCTNQRQKMRKSRFYEHTWKLTKNLYGSKGL